MQFRAVIRRNTIVAPLAFAVAIALVVISEGSYWQTSKTLEHLSAMAAERTSVMEISRGLSDAETGQRGYLLTGREEYREPYDKGLQRIAESFRYLDAYYSANAKPTEILRKLHVATESKLSELALTLSLQKQGKLKEAQEIVLSNIGKEQMDTFRAVSAELLDFETQSVARGRKDLTDTLLFNRIGVAILSLVGLASLYLYLRKSYLFERNQLEIQRMIQVERDRLEVEVSQRTQQLLELTQHLQTAREDERNRLARNLHDDLGSLLTSAKLDAARIRSRLAGTAPDALELLAHMVSTLNSGIALGRRIIEDLRPSALSNLGLVATLEILAQEFAEQSGVQAHCKLEPMTLKPDAELVIYRLVQESITNIVKYARASNVWIDLKATGDRVNVTVRDDGVGFSTDVKPVSAYGLMGMRFRIEALGGQLTVVSASDQGTTIKVDLPNSSPPAAA